MTLFDPSATTAEFLRSMSRAGVEATVVWSKGARGQASSNNGIEGIARATAALTIKGDALTRAAKALHAHMATLAGPESEEWDQLAEGEREAIRTMCKVVLAAAMKPDTPAPKLVSV